MELRLFRWFAAAGLLLGTAVGAESDAAIITVPGGGKIQLEFPVAGHGTYVFHEPGSGGPEAIGPAPRDSTGAAAIVVRTDGHIDFAIGSKTYARSPEFGEWEVFDVRAPGTGAPCRVVSLHQRPHLMVARCPEEDGPREVSFTRRDWGDTWQRQEGQPGRDTERKTPPANLSEAIERYDARAFLHWLPLADLNAKNENGKTPLEQAVAKRSRELALALVLMGADAETLPVGSADGVRAFAQAVQTGAIPPPSNRFAQAQLMVSTAVVDLALFRDAVTAGADLDAPVSSEGARILHRVRRADVTGWLIDSGAELEARDRRGRTPLVRAIERREAVVVDELIRRGAALDAQDHEGHAVLAYAVRGADRAATVLAARLLEAGVRPTRDALAHAIRARNHRTVALLLDSGAPFDPATQPGRELLALAANQGGSKVLALFRAVPGTDAVFQAKALEEEANERRWFVRLFIALLPYALMFALVLGFVPFVFALSLAPWFSGRWPHGLATLFTSEVALWLLYFPKDVRDSLASVYFFGARVEQLPVVLAIVVLVAAVIPIGAKAWFAFHIGERRGWANRVAAKAVGAAVLVIVTTAIVSHHANAWQGLRTTHRWVAALGASDDAP